MRVCIYIYIYIHISYRSVESKSLKPSTKKLDGALREGTLCLQDPL